MNRTQAIHQFGPEKGAETRQATIVGRLVFALCSCGVSSARSLFIAVELLRLDSIRRQKMPFLYAVARQRADEFTKVATGSRAWATNGLAGVTEVVESFVLG